MGVTNGWQLGKCHLAPEKNPSTIHPSNVKNP